MKPRDRAIIALEGKQPDIVPHFEIEMQLTEEYFGKHLVTREEWDSDPSKANEYIKKNAELLTQIADTFNYCIIFCHFLVPRGVNLDIFIDAIKVLKEIDEGKRLLVDYGDSTLAIPTGENMERLAYELADKPDEIKAEQEMALDKTLERGRKVVEAGIEGYIMGSDYCFNDGPFLSPTMFSEFVTPYLTKLIKGYRDMGAYTIKHTDGDIMPILDQLIEANPHALHSLDPMAGVDIKAIKKLYGNKVCLIGNVNCALMQTGSEEEILESCRYAMENGKPGGGYIFSTSNVIFKGMPKKSYDLMLDYYQKNNGY